MSHLGELYPFHQQIVLITTTYRNCLGLFKVTFSEIAGYKRDILIKSKYLLS